MIWEDWTTEDRADAVFRQSYIDNWFTDATPEENRS